MDVAAQGELVLKTLMKINRPQIARQPVCRARVLAAALLLAALFPAPAAEEAREGRIEFSDGKVVEGKISLTSGSALKIQSGSQVRALDLDRVREIRQSAEQEEMDRNWRFKEAGQTAKEFTGEPYPVRYVKTTVLLAGGESFSGHLYSTVLYVESGETAQKVVLLSKQRGDEGQTLKSMIYPTRISFAGAAAPDSATATLRLHWPGLGPKSELAALTRGELVQLTLTPSGRAGEFKMTSPLGREFFLAIKTGDRIVAGWPPDKEEKVLAQVQMAMPNSEDFFDARKVLGVLRDPAAGEIYALVLAARKGGTTLEQPRSQPWRLEIYRWKTEEGSDRLMLAGQNYLFRGIVAPGETAPAVELSEKLWRLRHDGETWTAGE
jgi:hypothetical protein